MICYKQSFKASSSLLPSSVCVCVCVYTHQPTPPLLFLKIHILACALKLYFSIVALGQQQNSMGYGLLEKGAYTSYTEEVGDCPQQQKHGFIVHVMRI